MRLYRRTSSLPDAVTPDVLDAALAPEDLSPEVRAEVRAALAADPALRTALAAADAYERAVRARLDAALPDRTLLVLLALDESGRTDALTDDERARLAHARPALGRLVERVPALADTIRMISAEATAFEAAWEAVEAPSEPRAVRADRAPVRPGRTRRVAWRAGVGLALALFVGVGVLLVQRDANFVTVAATTVQTVRLADGTTVRLQPGATLTYADPAADVVLDRAVRLDGDAYFDVAEDAAHPFTVTTTAAKVVVLGTRFGVRAGATDTEVTLVEGAVALTPVGAAGGVRLAPGQQSRITKGALPTTPQAVDVADALAWSDVLVFRETPAAAAAARLAARYGTPVAVADSLGDEPVTGTFAPDQPLAEVLRALALTLEADLDRTPDGGYRLR